MDGTHLEQVSEFKYLRCILDGSDTDNEECRRTVVSGRKVEVVPSDPWVMLRVCSLNV